MEGAQAKTEPTEDQVKQLQTEIEQLKKTAGEKSEIKVGEKTYTVEQVEKIAKDAENVARMTEEMRKSGEQANTFSKDADAYGKLQKRYGEKFVSNLLDEQQAAASDKLLPDLDLEGVDPEVLKFENARNQKINDFAGNVQEQLGQITKAVQALSAQGLKRDTTQDEESFARSHTIDLMTAEGQKQLDTIKAFGKENNCFEVRGTKGEQYHVIDKGGLDAAVLLMNLRDGRKAMSEGDTDAAELAMRNLLGGENTLNVKFEPTPSRQGASGGAQLDPILVKFQNHEPLTKKEVAMVVADGYPIPEDYPTAD